MLAVSLIAADAAAAATLLYFTSLRWLSFRRCFRRAIMLTPLLPLFSRHFSLLRHDAFSLLLYAIRYAVFSHFMLLRHADAILPILLRYAMLRRCLLML